MAKKIASIIESMFEFDDILTDYNRFVITKIRENSFRLPIIVHDNGPIKRAWKRYSFKNRTKEKGREKEERGRRKKRSGVLEIYKGETSREILSPDTV